MESCGLFSQYSKIYLVTLHSLAPSLGCLTLQSNNLLLAPFLAVIIGVNIEDFLFRTGNNSEPVKVSLSSWHTGGRRWCWWEAEYLPLLTRRAGICCSLGGQLSYCCSKGGSRKPWGGPSLGTPEAPCCPPHWALRLLCKSKKWKNSTSVYSFPKNQKTQNKKKCLREAIFHCICRCWFSIIITFVSFLAESPLCSVLVQITTWFSWREGDTAQSISWVRHAPHREKHRAAVVENLLGNWWAGEVL